MGIKKDKILIASILFSDRNLFYSQNNEDAIVIMLLHVLKLTYSDITYLELGTNHPVNLNNTYGLYRLGACGVLVEPNKDLHNFIEAIRPRDILVKKAVSLDGNPAEFYNLKSNELSTLSYDKLDKDFCDTIESFKLKETYLVETITINELFELTREVPDVVSIDIEGYDYAVLNQINFRKHRPKIFIIEMGAWGAKEQDGKRIKELLLKNGYLLFHNNGTNGIFIDEKYRESIRQYIVNKY
ncbi:MAG: FkbM family methyltransferase [Lachnospiraceae bacterium]|nr:FkbM family methyltransferase [Lachnospiraceae bacterium]